MLLFIKRKCTPAARMPQHGTICFTHLCHMRRRAEQKLDTFRSTSVQGLEHNRPLPQHRDYAQS